MQCLSYNELLSIYKKDYFQNVKKEKIDSKWNSEVSVR